MRRRSRGEEENNKETEKKTGEELLWESFLCHFHSSFLLSLLPFPIPEEYLIPLLSHPTILFVFFSPPGLVNVFLFHRGDCSVSFPKNIDDSKLLCQET